MGSPIGFHPDGSNCYTVNCSLQGHSPINMSKEAFIAELQKENEKSKWYKKQHIMKNVNMKYYFEDMENSGGRWLWTEEDRTSFMNEVKNEINRLEDERFVNKGYEFSDDVIHLYASVAARQAKETIENKPEWKQLSEKVTAEDAERRNAWFMQEDITVTQEYREEFDRYMSLTEIKEDWEKTNLENDMKLAVARIEEARYRRSTDWRAPSYMLGSFNPNIRSKPKRIKKYVKFLMDEAYVEAINMKYSRDVANGKDVDFETTTTGGLGTSMGTVINIVS